MKLYLDGYSKDIVLNNNNTLYDEFELYQKRLELPENPTSVEDAKSYAANKKLKEKLSGRVYIEDCPFEIQEGFLRSKMSIPPHIWNEYSPRVKGEAIAVEIIKQRLEQLEDFYRELENAKKGKG